MDNRGATPFAAHLQAKVVEQYDIGARQENQMGQVNSHLWKMSSSKGTFGVKAVPFDSQRIEYIYQINQHLLQAGFPGVTAMLITVHGRPYFEDDNGRCYYVYQWIQGHNYRFNPKKNQLQAITKLAELHQTAVGFFPQGITAPERWGQWPEKCHDRAMEINSWLQAGSVVNAEDEGWREIYEHGPYFLEEALMATDMISSPEYQEVTEREQTKGTFCHRDYAPRNLLVGSDQKIHIIDFDYSINDIRLYDLARFLQIVVSKYQWDWEVGRELLAEYHRIRPLQPAEQYVLAANLWFPRKFWLYAKHLQHQTNPRVRAALAESLKHTLLEEGMRVAFINQLQNWKIPRKLQ